MASTFAAPAPRQTNFKERASSDFALHADLALVSLNDPLDNGKSQASATGFFLSC
jgi:hypothetical protein